MQQQPTVLFPDGVWTPAGLVKNTCVVVHAGSIVELCAPDRYPNPTRLVGKVLLPGFVNAHSHAFQRAFRGHVQWSSSPEDDFWTWRDRMYAVARGLTPEGIEAVSALAFLEMVEAGFTTVGEFHYLHRQADGTPYDDPDELAKRVISAARSVGLRICLLRVVYAAGGFNVPLNEGQQRFRTDSPEEALEAVERLGAGPDPLVTSGLAPHSVRAVPEAWLPSLQGQHVLHAHVSEQPAEVESCRAFTGRTPLDLLADAGLVTSNFTAVHLTHPTPRELVRMRDANATVAVCPSTEMDLGDGFYPLEAREGIRLCIGTDSHARVDPFDEIRSLELHARGLAQRRIVMGVLGERAALPSRLLRHGTLDGGRALGLPVGLIEPGRPADLVAVDVDRPAAWGVPVLESIVFNATPEWVTDVWVGGEQVVRDGLHPERERILERARAHLT